MGTLLRIALGLVALLALLVVVAYALPSHYRVARSIEIGATPSKVYPLVAEVRAWKQWSAWNRRDPAMEIQYTGPEAGAGAQWKWHSKSEGDGEMTLIAAEPDQRIDYRLYFPAMNSSATGSLIFEPVSADVTRVTWTNEGELGNNPMMRWMGLAMDRMVGRDFDAGLANLKTLASR